MWQGIPISDLACVSWHVRERLLTVLDRECTEAAERNRRIIAARHDRPVAVEPDHPEVVAARIRDNGWNVEDVSRARRRDRMRTLRATSEAQRIKDRDVMRQIRAARRQSA